MRARESLKVGIVVERYGVSHRWHVGDAWRVVEVLPGLPTDVSPWTCLSVEDGCRRYYAGDCEVDLFRGETAAYIANLASAQPSVFVIVRRDRQSPYGMALYAATVDPGEVEAHADAGDDIIDSVPMPLAIRAWLEVFVARHHEDRPFLKRQRDRLDPEAIARGQPPARAREPSLG